MPTTKSFNETESLGKVLRILCASLQDIQRQLTFHVPPGTAAAEALKGIMTRQEDEILDLLPRTSSLATEHRIDVLVGTGSKRIIEGLHAHGIVPHRFELGRDRTELTIGLGPDAFLRAIAAGMAQPSNDTDFKKTLSLLLDLCNSDASQADWLDVLEAWCATGFVVDGLLFYVRQNREAVSATLTRDIARIIDGQVRDNPGQAKRCLHRAIADTRDFDVTALLLAGVPVPEEGLEEISDETLEARLALTRSKHGLLNLYRICGSLHDYLDPSRHP